MTDPTFTRFVLLQLLDFHYNPVTEALLGPLRVRLSQANQILSDFCGMIKMNNTPGWLGDLLPVYRLARTLDGLSDVWTHWKAKARFVLQKEKRKRKVQQARRSEKNSSHDAMRGTGTTKHKADINDINEQSSSECLTVQCGYKSSEGVW